MEKKTNSERNYFLIQLSNSSAGSSEHCYTAIETFLWGWMGKSLIVPFKNVLTWVSVWEGLMFASGGNQILDSLQALLVNKIVQSAALNWAWRCQSSLTLRGIYESHISEQKLSWRRKHQIRPEIASHFQPVSTVPLKKIKRQRCRSINSSVVCGSWLPCWEGI